MHTSTAYRTESRSVFDGSPRCANISIDASSWLSWGVYVATLFGALLLSPFSSEESTARSVITLALLGAIVAFFLVVVLLQRHMKFSLRATSFGKPRQLITTGVFRYTRNPIYVAFFIPLASLALISLPAALLGMLAYVHFMTRFVIRREEQELAEKFGADYEDYTRSVPRWFVAINDQSVKSRRPRK